ncbi:MAG: response regulator transcription factor [Ramlibacter sp.]|nr:response regulator transcription factor [Ramlibacter sp.]
MWQVLIVEDDPHMRDFFAASISRSERLALAASLGSVSEACGWLDGPGCAVDVLLVDLGLPDGSGLEVIRHAAQRHPGCESLVISMFGDEDNVLASIEAGALGYIHKDSTPDDVADSILQMKAGASPISPMIARRVLAKYLSMKEAPAATQPRPAQAAPSPPAGRPLLSAREQEVLALIARGFSYAEIARLQAVSVHTVQTHIKNLYRKLAVRSRGEAVYEATQMGLLGSPP